MRRVTRLLLLSVFAGLPLIGLGIAPVAAAESTGHQPAQREVMLPVLLFVNAATGSPTISCQGTVDIFGFDFAGATVVDFGSAAAPFTVVSPLEITATPGPGTPATGYVTVTGPGGTARSLVTYTTTGCSAPPTITSVSTVAIIDANGNCTLQTDISGTNFVDVTAVTIDGSPASSYQVDSSTEITATPGANSSVSVTTGAGTATWTNNTGEATGCPSQTGI